MNTSKLNRSNEYEKFVFLNKDKNKDKLKNNQIRYQTEINNNFIYKIINVIEKISAILTLINFINIDFNIIFNINNKLVNIKYKYYYYKIIENYLKHRLFHSLDSNRRNFLYIKKIIINIDDDNKIIFFPGLDFRIDNFIYQFNHNTNKTHNINNKLYDIKNNITQY